MVVATDRESHLITMNSNNYKDVCVHLSDIKYFESTGLYSIMKLWHLYSLDFTICKRNLGAYGGGWVVCRVDTTQTWIAFRLAKFTFCQYYLKLIFE